MPHRITIVHAADTHIDSPLRGLSRLGDDRLADALRSATRRAFVNLVDLVIERSADALVLAGDIYDGDARDYATARFLAEQLIRLDDAGIPVVMLAGNHDADSVITKTLGLPGNVTVLPTDRPGSVRFDELGIAFHGQGFATKAVLNNLARQYPEPVAGMVNVGVLHTSVSGYDGHDNYAPCSVADLKARGYEYFALGHVHKREVLCTGATTAAFSGNLQGRHVKETGPKGAFVVRLAPGEPAELEFVELDVARWEHLVVDVAAATTLHEAVDLVGRSMTAARQEAGDRPLVARITLEGTTPAAVELADLQRLAEEIGLRAGRLDVAVERIRNRARAPETVAGIPTDHQLLREVAAGLDEQRVDALLAKVRAEVDPYLRKLDLREQADPEQLVDSSAQSVAARLAGGAR